MVEHLTADQEVTGSIPVRSSFLLEIRLNKGVFQQS